MVCLERRGGSAASPRQVYQIRDERQVCPMLPVFPAPHAIRLRAARPAFPAGHRVPLRLLEVLPAARRCVAA